MGTSKRYAEQIDQRMNNRVRETIMRSGEPLSFSSAALQLDVYPLTRIPKPLPVRVWGDTPPGCSRWTRRPWPGPRLEPDQTTLRALPCDRPSTLNRFHSDQVIRTIWCLEVVHVKSFSEISASARNRYTGCFLTIYGGF